MSLLITLHAVRSTWKGLSITYRAGKTAALVGASGSGKSTIVSLVMRFYDPNSGSVTLDGNNVKTLNIKWLRSQIGLVSQEPTLFTTSVKENVAHGLIGTEYEDAPQEQKDALIKEACIKLNADGFITATQPTAMTPLSVNMVSFSPVVRNVWLLLALSSQTHGYCF
jgi:ABC-type multidrug transport system fused ATPase/permease subunit